MDRLLMAQRLPGGEAFHYRKSDHSAEIAQLRDHVGEGTRLEALTWAVAADLLQAHDETGISMKAYSRTRTQLDALYASDRLKLPFVGVLLVGY